MPHPCARQTTNAPNQTPCHRTQTAPPTHLRMRRAKTTNKHNATNIKQTHHHRNAPDGTLLAALPSLHPQSHAAYHAAIKEDATRRPQKKAHTKHTPLGETRQTTTHMHTRPTQTKAHLTSPSSPHAQARSLDRRGARKQARPRRAQRTRTQQSAATQTPRNTVSAERKTREDAAHPPPLPFLLVSRLVVDADLSLSLSLALSLSLVSAHASRLAPLPSRRRQQTRVQPRDAPGGEDRRRPERDRPAQPPPRADVSRPRRTRIAVCPRAAPAARRRPRCTRSSS